jgi:hypothetical protein
MPLDQCSVLVETLVTRWLSALYPPGGGEGRDRKGGRGAENRGSVNWAFMRPMLCQALGGVG